MATHAPGYPTRCHFLRLDGLCGGFHSLRRRRPGLLLGGLLSVPFDSGNFDDTSTANGAVMMSMIGNPYWPLSADATYVRTFTYLGGSPTELEVLVETAMVPLP